MCTCVLHVHVHVSSVRIYKQSKSVYTNKVSLYLSISQRIFRSSWIKIEHTTLILGREREEEGREGGRKGGRGRRKGGRKGEGKEGGGKERWEEKI